MGLFYWPERGRMTWNSITEFFAKLFAAPKSNSTPKPVELKPEPSTPAVPVKIPPVGEPDYVQSARADLGQAEIPGSKSNPYYNNLFKNVLGKDYGDETASCMAFVMNHLKKNGYQYLKTAWAADMDKVPGIKGNPQDPQLYQIATKISTVANSKRHAFFIVGVDKKAGTIQALGSNQGDTVKIVTFKISDLRTVITPIKAAGTQPTPPKNDSAPTDAKPLAWGLTHKEWDIALLSEITKADWSGVKMPIEKLSVVENVSQLISIMAKYESNFDPKTKYAESGHLAGVTSRGLLQISVDSANQSAYGFNVTADDLHNPLINLKVAVKIMHYQAKKHGVLFDGSKTSGAGAYWSVGRVTSGSFSKIKAYLNTL